MTLIETIKKPAPAGAGFWGYYFFTTLIGFPLM